MFSFRFEIVPLINCMQHGTDSKTKCSLLAYHIGMNLKDKIFSCEKKPNKNPRQ